MSVAEERPKVLLALTGGIAAYKSAELCRLLKKAGYEVRVVMTAGATRFISPLTLQALSGNPVSTELLDPQAEAGMGHIELARWPDLIVVAPASAHFIAQYNCGLAGDLLNTLLLASSSPVAIAPAMNQAMWSNPLTQKNLSELAATMGEKCVFWGPQEGEQACGDIGPGRLLEPLDIAKRVDAFLSSRVPQDLLALRVVITAGPTREALDPVRYITNHSSGKMGYALAEAFAARGADVTLVSGPVSLPCPEAVMREDVVSAQEMHQAVLGAIDKGCDIFVGAAAVADYRPKELSARKIKKQGDEMQIELCKNPDIVAAVAASNIRPFTVGFAAETNDVIKYAQGKLANKNLDMIIANDVSRSETGFNSDDNEVYVIWDSGQQHLKQQSKRQLSTQLVSHIAERFSKKKEG